MTLVERFLKYVSFDTQSSEETGTTPSTPGQMVFAKYLKEELEALTESAVIAQINSEDLQLSAGVMNVPVRILVPGSPNIFAVGSYTVECEISTGNKE